jgi:uncharacterized repeat protein (TIGR01451 family)
MKRIAGLLSMLLVLSPALPAWGACSGYGNKASLNEYYFGTDTNFIEILIHNNVQVPQSVWSTWQVLVHDGGGAPALSFGLNDANLLVCPSGSKTYLTFPVAAGLPSPAGTAVNVVLLDGAGDEVDYLKFSQSSPITEHYVPSCAAFSFDTDLVIGNLGNKDVARFPDGNGDWNISGGAGSGTTFTSCTGNNAGILKTVSVATVPLGSTALFSITVNNPDTRDITAVSVSDLLPAGLGYVSHTVSAGSYDQATGLWTIGTIAPSASATLTLTFRGDTLGTYTNTADLSYTDDKGAAQTGSDFSGVTVAPLSADHFVLSHDGYGINCLAEPLRVTAVDSSGATVTGYSGTLTLNTQSGRGTWTLTAGGGSFSDPTADDGLAGYTFVAADAGTALFALHYPEGTTPVNVLASEGITVDDDSEGLLAFTPSGFTVTHAPLSNPPPGSIPPFADQTAGASFTAYLTAYGQTATDPLCGVIEAYDGARNLRFWSNYNNPAYGGPSAPVRPTVTAGVTIAADKFEDETATELPVNFVNGQGQVTVKYKDVGRLGLNLKDVATPADAVDLPAGIGGGSTPFVVKPADFALTNIVRTADGWANPAAADQTGAVFIKAGDPFTVTVTARDAEGSATPSYGQETPAESVGLASTLVAPAGGNNPPVTTPGGFTFGNGIATATDLVWGEVGIVTLTPSIADGDYLGAGAVTGTSSGNLGRFTPHNFAVAANSPQFAGACGIFTYLGQPFAYSIAPVLTVTARNAAGATTLNYTGVWWMLSNASLTGKSYQAETGTLDLGLLPNPDPVIVDGGNGSGTLTFGSGGGIAFNRAAPLDPFAAEIGLQINVIDGDGIAFAGNPAAFGAPLAGSGIGFTGGKDIRWGRLAAWNAHGSELLPLSLPLRAESYSAGGFIGNADDSCSGYDAATATLGNYQGNLQAGETLLSGTATLLGGSEDPGTPLLLSAPGAGNDGSVDVTVSTDAWLRFDWDGDTVHDNHPSARASFGIYKGNPRLIYLQEVVP